MKQDNSNHISYRGTKKNPQVKNNLLKLAKQQNRSLNYIVEQALLEFLNKYPIWKVERKTVKQIMKESHQSLSKKEIREIKKKFKK